MWRSFPPPVDQHALYFFERRLKAPVVADRERHLVFGAGAHRGFCVAQGKRERLFGEDVLARFCRGDDLPGVQGMGRRQHDRVDRGVGQQFFVVLVKRKAVLAGEALGFFRGARRAGDETDRVALSLHARDQVLSPSAEADDRRADHGSFSAAAPDHGDITSLIPKRSPLRGSFRTGFKNRLKHIGGSASK